MCAAGKKPRRIFFGDLWLAGYYILTGSVSFHAGFTNTMGGVPFSLSLPPSPPLSLSLSPFIIFN